MNPERNGIDLGVEYLLDDGDPTAQPSTIDMDALMEQAAVETKLTGSRSADKLAEKKRLETLLREWSDLMLTSTDNALSVAEGGAT